MVLKRIRKKIFKNFPCSGVENWSWITDGELQLVESIEFLSLIAEFLWIQINCQETNTPKLILNDVASAIASKLSGVICARSQVNKINTSTNFSMTSTIN
jgi:Cdc6-like AAA superfamily ATPase